MIVIRADYFKRLNQSELRAVIAHELGERRLRSRLVRVAASWAAGTLSALIVAAVIDTRR